MRKPGSICGPVIVAGLILYILIGILKLDDMTAAYVVIGVAIVYVIALLAISYFSKKYSESFAKKIEPLMTKYQEDGDVKAYFDGVTPYENKARTRVSKNNIAINKLSILYEEEMWEECLKEVDRYDDFAKTHQEKEYALEVRRLCYQGMGDRIREMEIKRQLHDLKTKYGDLNRKDGNGEKVKAPLTAYECKKTMISWFIWAAIFFVGMFVGTIVPDIYGGISVACLFLGVASLIIAVIWTIKWFLRRNNETPLDL